MKSLKSIFKTKYVVLIFALASTTVPFSFNACSGAKPQLGMIDAVKGFTLDLNQKSLSSTDWKISISGQCGKTFKDVEWSADGGQTWLSIATSNANSKITCDQAGTFSTVLDLSTYPTIVGSLAGQTSYTILIRGQSDYGPSSTMSVLLLPPPPTQTPRFVAGSAIKYSSDGKYKLKSHIGGFVASNSTRGYKLQGQIHIK